MRILLPILAFLIISFSLKAQTPIWTSAWKLNNSGYATTVDFGKDSADNFYVAGSFFNQVKFGNTTLTTNGNQDIFLVKSDDNGNVKWAINFGGTSTDLVTDIHVDDSANVIVTGSFISNFIAGTDTITPTGFSYHGYVTKIDSSGNVVWTKTASGGSIQQGKSVITDDKGYVYWAGDYFGNCKVADVSVSQASGSYDVWLAKIGPGGETIRAQGYGGSSTDQVVKLALAGKAVYMTGNFFSTNFKIGSTTISTSGSYDIWLAKFDTAFNSTYLIKGGSSNNAVVYAIDANKDGSVSLCGNYISSFTMGGRSVSGNWNDAFVTRIGANSKAIFLTDIDGGSGFGQSVFTNSILSFDDGSVLVGGYFSAQVTIDKKNFSPNGGNDVLVASFKKNGAFNWLNQGGNSNSEISVGLVADSSDHYYVAGYFSTSTKFGNISLSGSGSGINYIAKGTEPVTAPVYNGLRNRVLYVDSTFEKSFAVKPATTAQYTLLNAPTGATLTADSGYFSFTPNASQIGKHKVVIKAENLGGDAKDSFFITVIVPVDAQNQVPKYACVNEEISFDQTYTDVGPVIILWEFGDGKKKNTDREFIRSYSDTGQYVVKMMVTNWHGEKDSLIDTIYIAPLPSADFVVNTACKGDSLRLTNSSQVAKGKITSTIWSKEKVFEQANYNYIKYAANYDTSDYQLLIETEYGCKDSITKQVVIKNLPSAGFSTFNACAGDDALFFDQSSTLDDVIEEYIWEFGNGKSKTVDYSSMTYKYDTGGTYQVKLTTVTASGCSNSYKTDVTVFNKPNSLFSADDFCFGKTLALNDLSTTPVGSILQRRWTTGDGKSYVTKTVNHNYDKPGKYKLQLVTANTLGCTDTMTQIIVVAAQPIPKIAADKACVGTVLNIRDLSDLGKNDEWLPNKWFKDGAKIDSGNMVSTVTINQTTTLKLVVETKAGCTDSTQVTLDPLFPVKPDFSLGSGCEGDTVNILDNFNRAELDSIIWIGLGVEVIKTDTTYKAIFKENNRHQLFARTIAQNGCKDSAVYNQFSVYNTPKGGFSYILDSATKSVKFKAIDTTANTYEWNFDNGQPATITAADSTTNTFNINGVYNVKLTAKTSNGCAMATDSVISIFFSNSVKNIGENLVSVYPNPTTDFIQIKLDYNNQLINWQLRSLNGKLIKSGVNPNITLKSVAKGNYLLITQTQKGTFTTQVNKL